MDELLPSKTDKILDKSGHVVVIESNVSLRGMYTAALKSLGFSNIHTSNDINIAIGILESEPVDWVITTLQTENKVNIYHLLNMCTKYENLKDIFITVSMSEADKKHVPQIAALGAFSWFMAKNTEEHIRGKFEELFKTISNNQKDPVLVAMEHLDGHLKHEQSYTD